MLVRAGQGREIGTALCGFFSKKSDSIATSVGRRYNNSEGFCRKMPKTGVSSYGMVLTKQKFAEFRSYITAYDVCGY